MSKFIIQNKPEYYALLQSVRENGEWEKWVLFMLKGVEQTAAENITLVKEISVLMQQYKQKIRPLLGKSYRHDLLNNLFSHPYTKIQFVQEILQVSRITATQYLEKIVGAGLLEKVKMGRNNYYLNLPLCNIFANREKAQSNESAEYFIESVSGNQYV